MANIPLSTIGVKVSYAVETIAGTRPTSGYTKISGIRSTPDFNIAPSTADATSFDNLEYTSKIKLLKEMPDTLEFGAIFGQEFFDNWETLVQAYKTAIKDNKQTWFCIEIPNFSKAIYFTGEPVEAGLSAMEANSAIEYSVFIIPTDEPVFESVPTATTL